MDEDNPMSGELKISIAAGVVHILSAAAALAFYLISEYGKSGPDIWDGVPLLIFTFLFLFIFSLFCVAISVIQFSFGVGTIVTGALRKKKLCALFCGLPLLADSVAAFFATIFALDFIIGGLDHLTHPLTLSLLLLALLSIAGIVLSIIAMVKNLSKKSDDITQ